MPSPRVDDDGQTVTLDLHGVPVEEAAGLARRLVREAARRGRRTVKIIHGQSTSSRLYQNRTIKNALYNLLDEGALGEAITHAWRTDGHLLLSLDVTASTDANPIRLLDVM